MPIDGGGDLGSAEVGGQRHPFSDDNTIAIVPGAKYPASMKVGTFPYSNVPNDQSAAAEIVAERGPTTVRGNFHPAKRPVQ
jgi:hypothetical protein